METQGGRHHIPLAKNASRFWDTSSIQTRTSQDSVEERMQQKEPTRLGTEMLVFTAVEKNMQMHGGCPQRIHLWVRLLVMESAGFALNQRVGNTI